MFEGLYVTERKGSVMVARNVRIILIQFNLCLKLNELKIEEKSEVVVEVSKSISLQMRAFSRLGVLVR